MIYYICNTITEGNVWYSTAQKYEHKSEAFDAVVGIDRSNRPVGHGEQWALL